MKIPFHNNQDILKTLFIENLINTKVHEQFIHPLDQDYESIYGVISSFKGIIRPMFKKTKDPEAAMLLLH